MPGPTWLTYPGWGVYAPFLAPAWPPACIAHRKLAFARYSRPIVSLQLYYCGESVNSATRPEANGASLTSMRKM